MKNTQERLKEIKERESLYRRTEKSFISKGYIDNYRNVGTMLLTDCNEFFDYKVIAKIKGEKIKDNDIFFVRELRSELINKGHKDIFNV